MNNDKRLKDLVSDFEDVECTVSEALSVLCTTSDEYDRERRSIVSSIIDRLQRDFPGLFPL
jgi:hypothetical protein